MKKEMKKSLLSIALLVVCVCLSAQTVKSRIVEDGGAGNYPAFVVSDATLPGCTIYRPGNLAKAVAELGPLPVIAFANGGCSFDPVADDNFNSEIASHGYILIGLGEYKTPEERAAEKAAEAAMTEKPASLYTKAEQLTEAINWAQMQNIDIDGEYYHCIDPERIGVMGSSCGGLQALAVSYDSRVKTVIMKNSGLMPQGVTSMGGSSFSKEGLQEVNVPMVYIMGNETDIAYSNALSDFEYINHIPVAFCSDNLVGHMGTVTELHGGDMARMVTTWLDYVFRGDKDAKKVFTSKKTQQKVFPDWAVKSKNIK
jgi:dienelactone hydrolase